MDVVSIHDGLEWFACPFPLWLLPRQSFCSFPKGVFLFYPFSVSLQISAAHTSQNQPLSSGQVFALAPVNRLKQDMPVGLAEFLPGSPAGTVAPMSWDASPPSRISGINCVVIDSPHFHLRSLLWFLLFQLLCFNIERGPWQRTSPDSAICQPAFPYLLCTNPRCFRHVENTPDLDCKLSMTVLQRTAVLMGAGMRPHSSMSKLYTSTARPICPSSLLHTARASADARSMQPIA